MNVLSNMKENIIILSEPHIFFHLSENKRLNMLYHWNNNTLLFILFMTELETSNIVFLLSTFYL